MRKTTPEELEASVRDHALIPIVDSAARQLVPKIELLSQWLGYKGVKCDYHPAVAHALIPTLEISNIPSKAADIVQELAASENIKFERVNYGPKPEGKSRDIELAVSESVKFERPGFDARSVGRSFDVSNLKLSLPDLSKGVLLSLGDKLEALDHRLNEQVQDTMTVHNLVESFALPAAASETVTESPEQNWVVTVGARKGSGPDKSKGTASSLPVAAASADSFQR